MCTIYLHAVLLVERKFPRREIHYIFVNCLDSSGIYFVQLVWIDTRITTPHTVCIYKQIRDNKLECTVCL